MLGVNCVGMTVSKEVEEMKDMLVELSDELVEETVTPEDMYFIMQVLEEYYDAISPREFGSVTTANIAWELAKQLSVAVETTPDLDWFNLYFVADGLYEAIRAPAHEDPDWSYDVTDPVEHPDGFGFELPKTPYDDDSKLFTTLDSAVDELTELLNLYVDIEGNVLEDDEMMSDTQSISMFVHFLQKRYAHAFPDDMLESSVSFKLVGLLTSLEQDATISNTDLIDAIRMVRKWAELRAHREHEMLCVGTK